MIPKTAFIGHPVDMDQYRAYVRFLKPDKTYNDQLLLKLFEWAPPYKVKDFRDISLNGAQPIEAMFVIVPFLPEMKDIKLKQVTNKIDQALAMAASEGCHVAALGAFTSIVLQGQESVYASKHNIKLTSGNTLTAVSIIKSVEDTCARFGLDLKQSTLAIIGASGDIGSGCVSYFGSRVKRMVCTARGLQMLESVIQKHKDEINCEVVTTNDNRAAVDQADVAIFVTSAFTTMFTVDDFKPWTIICDASAPLNVSIPATPRPEVFQYHGGIVNIPFEIDTGFDLGLASARTFYGCQVEGLLLAAHPELPPSWGRGNISAGKILQFLEVLKQYPALAPAYTIGNRLYAEDEMAQITARWKNRG